MNEFTEHYHLERDHQGLNNRLIDHESDEPDLKAAIGWHERLGGILKYYHRLAA